MDPWRAHRRLDPVQVGRLFGGLAVEGAIPAQTWFTVVNDVSRVGDAVAGLPAFDPDHPGPLRAAQVRARAAPLCGRPCPDLSAGDEGRQHIWRMASWISSPAPRPTKEGTGVASLHGRIELGDSSKGRRRRAAAGGRSIQSIAHCPLPLGGTAVTRAFPMTRAVRAATRATPALAD